MEKSELPALHHGNDPLSVSRLLLTGGCALPGAQPAQCITKLPRLLRPEAVFNDPVPPLVEKRHLEGERQAIFIGGSEVELRDPGVIDGEAYLSLPVPIAEQPLTGYHQTAGKPLTAVTVSLSRAVHVPRDKPAAHSLIRNHDPLPLKQWAQFFGDSAEAEQPVGEGLLHALSRRSQRLK
jgi:hypothetical protein